MAFMEEELNICFAEESGSSLRVHSTASRNFPLGAADGIAYVANRVNQGRFTELFSEPANEHLN